MVNGNGGLWALALALSRGEAVYQGGLNYDACLLFRGDETA